MTLISRQSFVPLCQCAVHAKLSLGYASFKLQVKEGGLLAMGLSIVSIPCRERRSVGFHLVTSS